MIPRPMVDVLEEIHGKYPDLVLESDVHGELKFPVGKALAELRENPHQVIRRIEDVALPIWVWWESGGMVYISPVDERRLGWGSTKK